MSRTTVTVAGHWSNKPVTLDVTYEYHKADYSVGLGEDVEVDQVYLEGVNVTELIDERMMGDIKLKLFEG